MADLNNVERTDLKKKKGSKKNKKDWRKKTNVEDVEEHLEDVRRQERTGGIVSEKSNEELFFIEKETKAENEKKTKDLKEEVQSSDEEEEYIPKSKRLKMKRMQEMEEEKRQLSKMKKPSHGVWTSGKSAISNCWVEVAIPSKPKKPKTVAERKSDAKAVDVCHPGASYNPDYENHQELLNDALQDEVKALKKQEKLEKKLKYLTKEEYNQESGWLKEMSEGLVENNNRTVKEKTESDGNEEEIILPKTVNAEDRKTNRLRRKERQRVEEEKVKQEEKMKKVKLNEVYRLKSLKRELKEKETELEEKRKKKAELEAKRNSKPNRLGKLKYEDPKLDFQLSEDLSGSLRGLKNEGDPMKDRMKSLEKRGVIEPRKLVRPHRKYKEKFVDKRSYKKPTVKDSMSVNG